MYHPVLGKYFFDVPTKEINVTEPCQIEMPRLRRAIDQLREVVQDITIAASTLGDAYSRLSGNGGTAAPDLSTTSPDSLIGALDVAIEDLAQERERLQQTAQNFDGYL